MNENTLQRTRRKNRGQPTGGQFAAHHRIDGDISLRAKKPLPAYDEAISAADPFLDRHPSYVNAAIISYGQARPGFFTLVDGFGRLGVQANAQGETFVTSDGQPLDPETDLRRFRHRTARKFVADAIASKDVLVRLAALVDEHGFPQTDR